MWGVSGTTYVTVSGMAVGTLGIHVWLPALRSALIHDVVASGRFSAHGLKQLARSAAP